MMKEIALLGSTGSIGQQTLLIAKHLQEKVNIRALAAHSNIVLLEKQAKEFQPELIAVYDKKKAKELQTKLPHIQVLAGIEGILAAATLTSIDLVVSAIVGTAGLLPTIAAIKAKKDVALANKEVLVSAGELVMGFVKQHQVQLIPVDSEHSALFQCLNAEKMSSVDRLIITASGGPFFRHSEQALNNITVEDALNHPTWQMGSKITIDSSTLMNKGCEVIEAHWLFNIPINKIDVLVHPQSIIHSMVEFVDNVILAQMGEPQMVTPIQYALTYPERVPGVLKKFDFTQHNILEFHAPDTKKFPNLRLAYESLEEGGSLPAYMNAANEILVERFLNQEITWKQISHKLECLMEKHQIIKNLNVETILAIDEQARLDAKTS